MNDDVKRLGYIWAEPKTPRYRKDHNALLKAGVRASEIWPGRDLARLVIPDEIYALEPGSIIMLAQHDSIGPTVGVRNRLLTSLAAMGALVEVIGHEPLLCDTPDALAEFQAQAIGVARAELARKNKPARGKGRPPKYKISEADKQYICACWAKPDKFDRADVIAEASRLAKKKVPEHAIKRWCGASRGAKSTDET